MKWCFTVIYYGGIEENHFSAGVDEDSKKFRSSSAVASSICKLSIFTLDASDFGERLARAPNSAGAEVVAYSC